MGLRRRGFRRQGEGYALRLDAQERAVLAEVLGQLGGLLDEDAQRDRPEDPGDPLAELVGIAQEASRPDDPALARLFPDAYRDDEEAAQDFRRYTERGLRQEKAASIALALDTLATEEDPIGLDAAAARAWVRVLNDLRLVIGVRIGVAEPDAPQPGAGGSPGAALYDWLTWLQGTLVQALMR